MIVTLDIVKQEIGRDDDFHDEMIARKLAEAEALILDYLKLDADTYTDVDGNNDFPTLIAAAVITATRILYEDPDADALSTPVQNMLHRLRDPALG